MGHYKNEIISQQREIDEIVSWYRYHEAHLPARDWATLLSSERLVELSLADWRQGRPWIPSRKRATEHVALNTRAELRATRYAQRAAHRRSATALFGWFLVGLSLVTGLALIAIEVL